jgi:hypothetical protein
MTSLSWHPYLWVVYYFHWHACTRCPCHSYHCLDHCFHFFPVEQDKWNDYKHNSLLKFEAVDNIPGSTAEFKDFAPNNSTQHSSKTDSSIRFTHSACCHRLRESINKSARRIGNTRVPIRQSTEGYPSRFLLLHFDAALIRRIWRNLIAVHLTINNQCARPLLQARDDESSTSQPKQVDAKSRVKAKK